jgi:hypothetical protein
VIGQVLQQRRSDHLQHFTALVHNNKHNRKRKRKRKQKTKEKEKEKKTKRIKSVPVIGQVLQQRRSDHLQHFTALVDEHGEDGVALGWMDEGMMDEGWMGRMDGNEKDGIKK